MTKMTMTKMSSSMFLLMLTLFYPMVNLASAEPISTVLPSEVRVYFCITMMFNITIILIIMMDNMCQRCDNM